MRALGNHLVILADSMGNVIPEKKKGASNKTGTVSGKTKKPATEVVDQKGVKKPTKKVVSNKATTKVVEETSKVTKSSAKETSSKENKVKTNTKEKSEKVVKSVKKEKIEVQTEEEGRVKVTKKPVSKKKQNNATNAGVEIEKGPVVNEPKARLQEKEPAKKRQKKATNMDDMTLKKRVPAKKDVDDKMKDIGSNIEKKLVISKSKAQNKDSAPPKKKQKISAVESSESEYSINVQINMVEKKKTAKK